MTDPLGQSQVIPYLQGLARKGHRITILSFEKRPAFLANKKVVSLHLKNRGINWVPLRYHGNPPVISTLMDLWYMWQQSKRLHQKSPYHIVHCRSFLASLIGLKLQRKYGIKFVFDMRGFWPDERVEGKLWDVKNPLYKKIYEFFKTKELEFINHADYSISLTDSASMEMKSWREVNEGVKIKVIPCCVDANIFVRSNYDMSELKTELGITEDNFVLTYLGSIGTWYLHDEMLQFFIVLKKHYPKAKFLFLSNVDSSEILQPATTLGIDNKDIIVKYVPRELIPKYIQLSDLSIFFILPSFSKKASSPTKLGELLSMGVPIICNSGIGDVDDIINNNNAGIIVEGFSDKDYDKAIRKFKDTTFSNLRKIAIENFSLTRGVEAYEEVYTSI